MPNPGWLSVLPPVLAIVLAIWTKQVYLSLFLGIWLGWTILADGNPILGLRDALEACINVFQDPGNTKVVAFSALVGALLAFTQHSGGVHGFINWISRRGFITTRRRAGLLAMSIGLVIFVESSITALVTGAVCRPIFDKLKISREKLAYFCDSTSAPICILIPLNAWGAYIIGLLQNQGYEAPLSMMLSALPLNFYAILAFAFAVYIAVTGRDFGPMARAERRARETGQVLRPGAEPLVSKELTELQPKPGVPHRMRNFIVPIAVMVAMMPVGLYLTGDGNIMQGSGSTSVFWAVLAATGIGAIMYLWQNMFTLHEITDLFFKGFGGLMPLALLMMFAFAIGKTTGELKTGHYVAGLADQFLHPSLVPAILFLIACFIAFSTGTSWGTFAIMIPIAVPMAKLLGTAEPLAIAAVLGGGIFGDHCSPISDTTIISSMASASDHIDHVNTQLPYALTVAAVTLVLYLVAGIIS
ncbi:MAG: Na+/H+ antiporter NhaC family protein [candidate division KSB1 bacterium]|nr:Na+/H+ antiporter NhaC family protein [candidate division KSB1 bacterium]MDQ7066464.1 Na+/H+ antiporter NhaC family protein [candidate division KSB1 bacterium]